jgi:hypothetical protein
MNKKNRPTNHHVYSPFLFIYISVCNICINIVSLYTDVWCCCHRNIYRRPGGWKGEASEAMRKIPHYDERKTLTISNGEMMKWKIRINTIPPKLNHSYCTHLISEIKTIIEYNVIERFSIFFFNIIYLNFRWAV